LIEFFFQSEDPSWMDVVHINCPHVLRYITTAVIASKKRRYTRDLARAIQQETYRDPITEFIERLETQFDFDGALESLQECEQVLSNDFFLASCKGDFLENARLFVFESYCRIHQRIDIGVVAKKLRMEEDSAERWIVNLIRNSRLPEAKIDSAHNHVLLGASSPPISQQVFEKSKVLCVKTLVMANNVGRKQLFSQSALANPVHPPKDVFVEGERSE